MYHGIHAKTKLRTIRSSSPTAGKLRQGDEPSMDCDGWNSPSEAMETFKPSQMTFSQEELEPKDFGKDPPQTKSLPNKTRKSSKTEIQNGFQSLLGYNDFHYRDTILQLIYCACTKITEVSASGVGNQLDDMTAELFIHTAIVSEGSSREKLESLAGIAELTYPDSNVPLPTTRKAIEERILSTKGKRSFRSLLPVPVIEPLAGGHSYAGLVDLIGHAALLATSKDYCTVRDRHLSLLKSNRFVKFKAKVETMIEEKGSTKNQNNVIVMCFFWADGFEPNATKKNRGSVWALTATLIYYDELQEICQPKEGLPLSSCSLPSHFHHTNKEKDTNFYVLPFGCVMDNPERRTDFWLLSHSSKAHTMFGQNCRYDLLQRCFETTAEECGCTSTMEEYIKMANFDRSIQIDCDRCLSFSLSRLKREGKYETAVFSKDGETDTIPGEELFSAPGPLTSSILIAGWKYSFSKHLEGSWTEERSAKYLAEVLCLSLAARKRFFTESNEKMEYLAWKNNDPQLDADVRQKILENLERDQAYYENLGRHNPLWDLFELENTYETIMHNCMNTGKHVVNDLIILSVIKPTMKTLGDTIPCGTCLKWSSGLKLKGALVHQLVDRLQMVQNLKVEDFKARTISRDTPSFGGYVAENYRALLVLAPWFFSFLNDAEFQRVSPGEPASNNSMDNWSRENLQHYLHTNRVRKCQLRSTKIQEAVAGQQKEKPKTSFRGIESTSITKAELFPPAIPAAPKRRRYARSSPRMTGYKHKKYIARVSI